MILDWIAKFIIGIFVLIAILGVCVFVYEYPVQAGSLCVVGIFLWALNRVC
jgi:hypothetical protein